MLKWCCGSELCQVKVVSVLRHILLDWRVWHKADEGVWSQLLGELEKLLSHDRYGSVNRDQFVRAGAIKLILLTTKVRVSTPCFLSNYRTGRTFRGVFNFAFFVGG